MSEIIWFIGENGAQMCMERDAMTPPIIARLKQGTLRRVHPDGTPWEGDPFPPPPLPAETTIDTLRGYRYWTVLESGVLASALNFPWPTRGVWAQARCEVCSKIGRPVPSQEQCRDYGYGCGLYAASTPDRAIRIGGIWGVIEAKGRIVAHRHGFRAEYARPVAFADPGGGNDRRPRARLAASRYGLPLLPVDQLLAEYAPDVWTGDQHRNQGRS